MMTEAEILQRNSYLRQCSLDAYYEKFAGSRYKLLLHYPPNGAIKYLMEGWQMILNHMGIPCVLLPLGEDIRGAVEELGSNVFITCEEFKADLSGTEGLGLLIGKVGSHLEIMTDPCHFVIDFSLNELEPSIYVSGGMAIPLLRLPFGCNPLLHYAISMKKLYNWSHIGTLSGSKMERAKQFIGRVVNSIPGGCLGGVGWSSFVYRDSRVTVLQEISLLNASLYYQHSLVNLNIHQVGQIDRFINMNERTFIIPACAGFQITDKPMACDTIFDQGEIVATNDPDEYLALVKDYASYPEKRLPFIEKAQERVFGEYTLFHSMEKLLGFIEMLING